MRLLRVIASIRDLLNAGASVILKAVYFVVIPDRFFSSSRCNLLTFFS